MSNTIAIEAALFSSGRPLTISELSEATGIKINECKKGIKTSYLVTESITFLL